MTPSKPDELDDWFRKLEERIEYNRHDMGEMGMFVRVEYVKNFLDDSKAALQAYITEACNRAVDAARSNDPFRCDFGHTVYSHNSAAGWCCACGADVAFLESRIAAALKSVDGSK